MQLGLFLIIAAVVHGVLGLVAFLVPGGAAAMFGIGLDAGGSAIARLLGATMLGMAATFWFARTLTASDVLKGVLIGGFVVSGLSLIIAIFALTGGIIAPRGWIGAVARAAFTVGFGYFAFLKPAKIDA